jgi:hypothetical protein
MLRNACSRLGYLVITLFSLGAILPRASAQTETATIAGRVTDPSGAVVSNATLNLVNIDNGMKKEAKTNGSGIYVIANVASGHYRMRAERDGFKVSDLVGLTVNVQDNIEENFRLEIGSASESVTVDASGLNINTTDAAVGTVIDRQFVENIPMNGRSFQTLVLLSPGVTTNSPQATSPTDAGEFSVNGMRTDSNSNTVDGASASNAPQNVSSSGLTGGLGNTTALGTTQATLMLDAMEQFRISTSTYSAEYGNHPGAQISYRSRSGTNQYHGSLYDYLRNSAFDANNWFNTYSTPAVPTPAERQNDFGGTFGGPISIPHLYSGRDRLFLFFAYEGLRVTQPLPSTIYYVPSNGTHITANYSNALLKNLRANSPASLQPFLNSWPVANCDTSIDAQCIDYAEGGSPYIFSPPSSGTVNALNARMDYQIIPSMRLFARYQDTLGGSTAYGTIGPYESTTSTRSRTYLVGADNTFGAAMANELRLQYSPATWLVSSDPVQSGGAGAPYNLYQAQGLPVGGETYVRMYYAPLTYSTYQQSYGSKQFQPNITDSFTWSFGKHVLKFGGSYVQTTGYYDKPGNFNRSPTIGYYFQTANSFLSNLASASDLVLYAPQSATTKIMGFFAQDEWRVIPRLSLSLGLRWDIDPAPSLSGTGMYTYTGDVHNPSTLGLSQPGAPLYKTNYTNFAPRVGLALILNNQPGHETVLRAGGGVFYDTIHLNTTFGAGDALGTSLKKNYANLPFPLTPTQINLPIPTVPTAPYSFIYYPNNNIVPPYSMQFNASLQQAFGGNQTFTLGYVASMGKKLSTLKYYSVSKLNPQFASFTLYENGPGSSYNSLQIQYQRQMSHGLQAIASYTWAHALDWASVDGYADVYPIIKGNSDHDVRHNFTAAAVYNLPSDYSNYLEKVMLAHWVANLWFVARTAFPYELQGPAVTDPITGDQIYGELNWNGKNPYVYKAGLPGGRQINPAVFSVTTSPLGAGSAPRNFLRGFGEAQANVALQRNFPLYERAQLQFRAEAFNITNHANFGTINNSCGATKAGAACSNVLMGQATNTLNGGLGNLSALYQQGGPRSLQFMLKLDF